MPLYLFPEICALVCVVRAADAEEAVEILWKECNIASSDAEYDAQRRELYLNSAQLLEPEGEPGIIADTLG